MAFPSVSVPHFVSVFPPMGILFPPSKKDWKHPHFGLPFSWASCGLWIVSWVFRAFELISIYQWVHIKWVLLWVSVSLFLFLFLFFCFVLFCFLATCHTLESPEKRILMRGCLDQAGLWRWLWKLILILFIDIGRPILIARGTTTKWSEPGL